MNSSQIVSVFKDLETKVFTSSTLVSTMLSNVEQKPDIVTMEKGTILYVSRDKNICKDNDVLVAAMSIDFFLYTEEPRPKIVPPDIKNKALYADVGEHRFYRNRVYSKIVLDRDIRLLDCRQSTEYKYLVLKNSLLNVDGIVSCKRSNTNLVYMYIDDVLDYSTVVKRIRPMSKSRYAEAKTKEYSDRDIKLFDQSVTERVQLQVQ